MSLLLFGAGAGAAVVVATKAPKRTRTVLGCILFTVKVDIWDVV
jgi:hypothetical protein